jgi:hypothetical protein
LKLHLFIGYTAKMENVLACLAERDWSHFDVVAKNRPARKLAVATKAQTWVLIDKPQQRDNRESYGQDNLLGTAHAIGPWSK